MQGLKETRKMFGGIKGAASSVMGLSGAMGPLSGMFSILSAVMKGVQPLLDMVNSLFGALSAGVSKALIPVFQQFAALLPSLIPIFIKIGEFIGYTIAVGLEPLLMLLEMFMPILMPLLDVIIWTMEIGLLPLTILFEVIFAMLEPLLPLFEDLGLLLESLDPILAILTPLFTWFIKLGLLPLIGAIYGIGIVVASIMDFFSFGMGTAVKDWNALMLPIMESMLGMGGGGGGTVGRDVTAGSRERDILGFQYGTDYINRGGLVGVHRGEGITPSGYTGRTEALLMRLLRETEKARKEKNFRNMFKRR